MWKRLSASAAAPLVIGLLLGAALRVGTLRFPGTRDMGAWKTWSYHAVTRGPTELYGHGIPLERHVLTFGGVESAANYPPLALYELAAVGSIYSYATGGRFPDTPALTATIRGSIILMEACLALVLFFAVRRVAGTVSAQCAAMAYWLNPAAVITTALGYIDIYFTLPAAGALVAAAAGRPIVSGGLLAAAVMTKPQALFIAPAVGLALWNVGDLERARNRIAAATISAAVIASLIVAPVVAAGAIWTMTRAVGSMAMHDMLSGNACNLWWMAGHLLTVTPLVQAHGLWNALTMPAEIVSLSRVAELGYPNPRLIGSVLTLGAIGWGVWTARRMRELAPLAALGAFLVHAYFTLSVQIHENHLFAAVPFLVLAAASGRRWVPMLAVVSGILAANLYLFYGISGDGPAAAARTATRVDSTVILAVANCVALVWFAWKVRSLGHPRT